MTRAVPVPRRRAHRRRLRARREPRGWLQLRGVRGHNLTDLDVDVPLGVLTAVTGVSGSGKSTLVSRVLGDVVAEHLRSGAAPAADPTEEADDEPATVMNVRSVTGLEALRPAGAGGPEADRPHAAVQPGHLHRTVRRRPQGVRRHRRGPGPGLRRAARFSFNVAGGRCETCQGEGFVSVELLFLPGSYDPCPDLRRRPLQPRDPGGHLPGQGHRAGPGSDASTRPGEFLADLPAAARRLEVLAQVGLGYLRLGQPATELSGGEAQRIKLATELQRARRGHTLYLLDEPTTGLHPADVQRLLAQLHALVDGGSTVVLVEHDMDVVADADRVIDLGPAGGDAGGRIVAAGTPEQVAAGGAGVTAPYLARRVQA